MHKQDTIKITDIDVSELRRQVIKAYKAKRKWDKVSRIANIVFAVVMGLIFGCTAIGCIVSLIYQAIKSSFLS